MKRNLFFIILILFIVSCSNKPKVKKYKCEITTENGFNNVQVISATTDSAAYVQALILCTAQNEITQSIANKKSNGVNLYGEADFALYDDSGNDITNSVYFANKDSIIKATKEGVKKSVDENVKKAINSK